MIVIGKFNYNALPTIELSLGPVIVTNFNYALLSPLTLSLSLSPFIFNLIYQLFAWLLFVISQSRTSTDNSDVASGLVDSWLTFLYC